MTTTIVSMFLANSLSLVYHRWTNPNFKRPYEMPFYPWPVVIQVTMFSFIFLTSDNWFISGGNPLLELGLCFLLLGSIVFLAWSKRYNEWPFNKEEIEFDNAIVLTTKTVSCSMVEPTPGMDSKTKNTKRGTTTPFDDMDTQAGAIEKCSQKNSSS